MTVEEAVNQFWESQLEPAICRVIADAVAKEREACAKLADDDDLPSLAEAIRGRKP